MLRYQGAECPACNKVFEKDDDIVVCPVCGAPHHRHCYAENAGCALESQHTLGKEWQRPRPGSAGTTGGQEGFAGDGPVHCPSCGGANPPGGIFCQLCGSRLAAPRRPDAHAQKEGPSFATQFAVFASPYGGLNPEDEIDGISVKEYATYVGPASYHYLPRFKLLAQNRGLVSFNWSAFFFTFFYFLYRKIGKAALIAGIVFLLTLAPSFYYAYEYAKEAIMQYGTLGLPLPPISTPALDRIFAVVKAMQAVQFGFAFASGFWANRIYLKSVVRKIKKIRVTLGEVDTSSYIEQLAHSGGVSVPATIVAAFGVIACYIAVSYLLGFMLLS